MPEWVFIAYLIFSFLSLTTALFIVEWKTGDKQNSVTAALGTGLFAVIGAALLMVPVFALVYFGMLPKGPYRTLDLLINLLVSISWAHLAHYAWATGRTSLERHAVGAALYLALLTLFLGIWTGALVRFRYAIVVAIWGLLCLGLSLWLGARGSFHRVKSALLGSALLSLLFIGLSPKLIPVTFRTADELHAAQFGFPIPFIMQELRPGPRPLPLSTVAGSPLDNPTEVRWGTFLLAVAFSTLVIFLTFQAIQAVRGGRRAK
jgi:hypothetical protein